LLLANIKEFKDKENIEWKFMLESNQREFIINLLSVNDTFKYKTIEKGYEFSSSCDHENINLNNNKIDEKLIIKEKNNEELDIDLEFI